MPASVSCGSNEGGAPLWLCACLPAVGCAKLGQLLVWEWRSDSYVLKQQGHYHDISTTAFSPDGALVATGSDDRKVRPCMPLAAVAGGRACLWLL